MVRRSPTIRRSPTGMSRCSPARRSLGALATALGLRWTLVVVLAEKPAVPLVDEFRKRLVRRACGGGLEFEVLAGNGGRPAHPGVRHDPLVGEPVGAGIG